MSNLRDQLMTIRQDKGSLTPADVVDAARPDDHPLHDRFEWDDLVAGEKWRSTQAAELIRSVRIVFTRTNGEESSVRFFHSTHEDDGGSAAYQPLEEIVTDPMATRILLNQMEREWKQFKARYGRLAEFVELLATEQVAA